ncbi:MAG: plasmid stabilization protein [SAR86 cluster bacterium]|uniref:Plasmid stabilization protein n=1 Tax=SAR86 cluster bacterium TaxID=2030880 RepID=A0A2A5C7U1_9GAMM|nr:MAG: plasmid stabilization protein [SAR86 cluster bacterium]
MKIHYTPESIEDLARLRNFIADKNPPAAQRMATELLSSIKKLKVFPKMGVGVTSSPNPEAIRDLFIGQYTVRYLLATDMTYILRMWHDKESERDL